MPMNDLLRIILTWKLADIIIIIIIIIIFHNVKDLINGTPLKILRKPHWSNGYDTGFPTE